MKRKTLQKMQVIVWIFGFIAVGLLVYGIVRVLLQ